MPTIDSHKRLINQIESFEPKLRFAFLQAVRQFKGKYNIPKIQQMIDDNGIEDLLNEVIAIPEIVVSNLFAMYLASGNNTAEVITNITKTNFAFNSEEFSFIQPIRLRIVNSFVSEQKRATIYAYNQSRLQQLNKYEQAKEVFNSIGLTFNQIKAVHRYKRVLLNNSAQALDYTLREKKYDKAFKRGVLTDTQMMLMVKRYTDNYLTYRAKTISDTEVRNAVLAGNHDAYLLAARRGIIQESNMVRRWSVGGKNIRTSHKSMAGQERGLNEPFITGEGNLLMYPCDSHAPADEVISCKCMVTTIFLS